MADDELGRFVRSVGTALDAAARSFRPAVTIRHEGRVLGAADGVVRIAGLREAGVEELVDIGADATGLVLSLGANELSALALHGGERIRAGDAVRSTGAQPSIPVGENVLGRVIDPLGRPLDGVPLLGTTRRAPLERPAPGIAERAAVHRPMLTGSLAIDAMLPIGCGQRELILGEERTGKTALALDVMIRQRTTDVVGVYVAVGRRRSEVWQIVEELRRGAGRWVVVAAFEDAAPGIRYLAPYAGTAVAEHYMRRGEHALVVYDDLTSHAVAWRELSLLLRRAPGREAYPGDIFYLHSRLLERAAQLSADHGGGSLTALPLATLEAGRLTAYIPTNLISITDGQIVLSQALFAAGQKPAIDAGLSVSRVGAKAQPQALRELAGRLRLDYASFLELETFARLGTRLEDATRRRIEVGRRVRVLLRGARLEPLTLFEEVARLVIAADHELLMLVPEEHLLVFSADVTARARRDTPLVAARVERDAVLADADRRELAQLARELARARFAVQPGSEPAPGVAGGGA